MEYETVSNVIRARRTSKVLALDNKPATHPHDDGSRIEKCVFRSIEDAGFAPFHYERGVDGLAEPWRFYFLGHMQCRRIADQLPQWFSDMRPGNKLPAMLNACDCLVLVTWLPQFGWTSAEPKQVQVDEEHLAATAAATQNLLLSLTAQNLMTYWSSGGFFRTPEMFDRLQIDRTEKLLSAIFINHRADEDATQVLPGKQHTNRSAAGQWTRIIE